MTKISFARNRTRLINLFISLKNDCSGLALIEFAFALPVLIATTLTAAEVVDMASKKMEVNYLGKMASDTAGRYKEKITGEDVMDILAGVENNSEKIDFSNRGQLVISSVEREAGKSTHWVNWQACFGNASAKTKLGKTDKTNIANVGNSTDPNKAIVLPPDSNAIVAEVNYKYQPLLDLGIYGFKPMNFYSRSIYIVRDRVNGNIDNVYSVASGIYQRIGSRADDMSASRIFLSTVNEKTKDAFSCPKLSESSPSDGDDHEDD